MVEQERLKALAGAAGYRVETLADLLHLSCRQLERQFKRDLKVSPREWLADCRVYAAKRRLLEGYFVQEVAVDLGYKHSSHFCTRFKQREGMTPLQFVSSCNHTESMSQKRHNVAKT